MYVLIMRVFSIAATLFTLMSQEICSSGSQTFTIRTLAAGMHTTRSMPSREISLSQAESWWQRTFVQGLSQGVHFFEPFHGRLNANVDCPC